MTGHLGSAFYLSCDLSRVTDLEGRDFGHPDAQFMIMFRSVKRNKGGI